MDDLKTAVQSMGVAADPCPSCVNSGAPPLGSSPDAFWKLTRCADLFSSRIPAWLDGHEKALAGVQGTWFPLCSLTEVRGLMAKRDGHSLDRDLRDVAQFAREEDACVPDPEPTPDTQSNSDIKPMNAAQRASYLAQIEAVHAHIGQSCCGEDRACRALMDKIELRWCKPQTNPRKPDPCIENGTYYNADSTEKLAPELRTLALDPAAPLPKFRGYIQIAPLMNESGPNDDIGVLAHEFSHGCSDVRRMLPVLRGDRAAVKNYLALEFSPPQLSCRLTDDAVATYRKLYGELALSPASFECLAGLAREAIHRRFTPGLCQDGCPKSYLEESFADWLAFSRGDVPKALWPKQFCEKMRDANHPLSEDELRCFLDSDTFAAKIKGIFECRE